MLKTYMQKFKYLGAHTSLDTLTGNIYAYYKISAGTYLHGMVILAAWRRYKVNRNVVKKVKRMVIQAELDSSMSSMSGFNATFSSEETPMFRGEVWYPTPIQREEEVEEKVIVTLGE